MPSTNLHRGQHVSTTHRCWNKQQQKALPPHNHQTTTLRQHGGGKKKSGVIGIAENLQQHRRSSQGFKHPWNYLSSATATATGHLPCYTPTTNKKKKMMISGDQLNHVEELFLPEVLPPTAIHDGSSYVELLLRPLLIVFFTAVVTATLTADYQLLEQSPLSEPTTGFVCLMGGLIIWDLMTRLLCQLFLSSKADRMMVCWVLDWLVIIFVLDVLGKSQPLEQFLFSEPTTGLYQILEYLSSKPTTGLHQFLEQSLLSKPTTGFVYLAEHFILHFTLSVLVWLKFICLATVIIVLVAYGILLYHTFLENIEPMAG